MKAEVKKWFKTISIAKTAQKYFRGRLIGDITDNEWEILFKKINGRGGKREGAGRPRQFVEPTTINFKCEVSHKLAAKEKYGTALNQMFVEWLKSVLK